MINIGPCPPYYLPGVSPTTRSHPTLNDFADAVTIDDRDCGPDTVFYGGIDHNKQRSGVQGCLTKEMIGTGSKVPSHIKPPGFAGQGAGHARGHLLGAQLGGSGKIRRNVVTLFQDPVNNSWMRGRYENRIREAMNNGNVMFTSKPIYKSPTDEIPAGVWMTAYSDKGFSLSVVIPNVRP